MGLGVLITLAIVALNGFFVAAEFAIIKIRSSQLEVSLAAGSRRAKLAKSIVENLNAYLSATQLGVTLSSLALGWVGEEVFSDLMEATFAFFHLPLSHDFSHQLALPVAFLLITTLHVIFGELAPKWIALQHPLAVTYAVALPLRIFFIVFSPFIRTIHFTASTVLRLFGIQPVAGPQLHTEEEILLLLEESREGGTIASSEQEMIEKVFSFDERVVKQIMIPRPRVLMLDGALPLSQALEQVMREGYTRVPVYSGNRDNIIGVVNSKDLYRQARQSDQRTLRDFLRPAYFVPETKRIREVLKEFQKRKTHIAIIVDEFGATTGIVTIEDIVEELVGEIQDEHDEEAPLVEKKADDLYFVNALASIIDVNKSLPEPLSEGSDYETVAGLINVIFGGIPEVNQKKPFEHYEFCILKRSPRQVEQVSLRLLPAQQDDDEIEEPLI